MRVGSVKKAGSLLAEGDSFMLEGMEYRFRKIVLRRLEGWVVEVENPRARVNRVTTVTIEPWKRYDVV